MMAHTAVNACHPLIREWRNSSIPRVWVGAGGKQCRGDPLGWECAAACPRFSSVEGGRWASSFAGSSGKRSCWLVPVPESCRRSHSGWLMYLQENNPKRAVQTCEGFDVCKCALAGGEATPARCVWAGRRELIQIYCHFFFISCLALCRFYATLTRGWNCSQKSQCLLRLGSLFQLNSTPVEEEERVTGSYVGSWKEGL